MPRKKLTESPSRPPKSPSAQSTDPYPSTHNSSLRLSYTIGRGETGVLSFEPYKSDLLPLWRFRTPSIARESSSALWDKFIEYDAAGDFVGMDMARKFIQMGMTRAKRYARHKGGRKYDKGTGIELAVSENHEDKTEKEEASKIFKEAWERCRVHKGYSRRKDEFMRERKEWVREEKGKG